MQVSESVLKRFKNTKSIQSIVLIRARANPKLVSCIIFKPFAGRPNLITVINKSDFFREYIINYRVIDTKARKRFGCHSLTVHFKLFETRLMKWLFNAVCDWRVNQLCVPVHAVRRLASRGYYYTPPPPDQPQTFSFQRECTRTVATTELKNVLKVGIGIRIRVSGGKHFVKRLRFGHFCWIIIRMRIFKVVEKKLHHFRIKSYTISKKMHNSN